MISGTSQGMKNMLDSSDEDEVNSSMSQLSKASKRARRVISSSSSSDSSLDSSSPDKQFISASDRSRKTIICSISFDKLISIPSLMSAVTSSSYETVPVSNSEDDCEERLTSAHSAVVEKLKNHKVVPTDLLSGTKKVPYVINAKKNQVKSKKIDLVENSKEMEQTSSDSANEWMCFNIKDTCDNKPFRDDAVKINICSKGEKIVIDIKGLTSILHPFKKLLNFYELSVIFLGKEEKYLEVKFAMKNNYLVILYTGRKDARKIGLPIDYNTTTTIEHWHGIAKISKSYFPPNVNKFIAYAIYGFGENSRCEALSAVPEGDFVHPDFHTLELSQDIDLSQFLPENHTLSDVWIDAIKNSTYLKNFHYLHEKDSRSVMLSWDPVCGDHVQGYKIQTWTLNDEGERFQEQIVENTISQCLVTISRPYSRNFIQVLAFDEMYHGPVSPIIEFTIPEDTPGPVTNVQAFTSGSHAIYLMWEKPKTINGILTGYNIYYQEMLGSEKTKENKRKCKIEDPEKRAIKLSDLKENMKYHIEIFATTCNGEGEKVYIEVLTNAKSEQGLKKFIAL